MGVVDESFMRERERERERKRERVKKRVKQARYVTVFVSIDREKPHPYCKARTHVPA